MVITTSTITLLRRAVSAATLAPSVHNTQPWRFAISADSLEIRADRSRQLGVLDPTGRQMFLSLGCAVLNARVSLATSGAGCAVRRFPDPARPDVVAVVQLRPDLPADPELARLDHAMRNRQTNRRHFTDVAVPPELLDELIAVAAAEGAVAHPVHGAEDRAAVARLSQRADSAQITDAAYRAELRRWTTSDPSRLDGVRAMVVPHVDGTSGDDVPIRDFDTSGTGWLPAQTHSSLDQCLILLGTRAENPAAWLRAGEALEHVWLVLTDAGYSASLFTQPIEVGAVREELRTTLRLEVHPHLLMRVGRADVAPSTHRRPVEEVLDS